jgi:hypothetical protein
MVGLRDIMAAAVVSSAFVSLPASGQVAASASLTHTVSVTVPPRLKVQVANLAFSSPTAANVSSIETRPNGLSITVNATQAWVLSIGSVSRGAAPQSRVQWSGDRDLGVSPVSVRDVAVASGGSYDAKASNVFFRSASSGTDIVVLTIAAP